MPIEQQPIPVLAVNQPDEELETPHHKHPKPWVLILGAFFLGALLFGAGAYFFAQQTIAPVSNDAASIMPPVTPGQATESAIANPSETPKNLDKLPDESSWKTYTNTAMENDPGQNSFAFIYSIRHPAEWVTDLNVFTNNDPSYTWTSDTLTLTNENRKIVIHRPGPSGGGGCLFPGDAEIEGPYGRLGEYLELSIDGNTYRRAKHLETEGGVQEYTVCQKYQESGEYGTPTNFGHISYSVPVGSDVTELDAILTTLKKL